MKNKKILTALLLAGMLFTAIGTTAFAAGPASFYGYTNNSSYVYTIENRLKNDKYVTMTINACNARGKYQKCLYSRGTVLSGLGQGKNGFRASAKLSLAPCVKGIGAIYNTTSKGSGVAASYSSTLRR